MLTTCALSQEGFTPLHVAAAFGFVSCIDIMVAAGGDPKAVQAVRPGRRGLLFPTHSSL